MLCLVNISNCVLMECGHSSICFSCTMHLAINSRAKGAQPFCHLCRKPIRFALKIEVPEDCLMAKEYSPDTKKKKRENIQQEKYVRILSFVDMSEAKPIRVPGNPRRRKFPKFKEKVITGDTRWVFENADFSGLMNEFRYQEKPPGHAPERSKS